ncbi:MAG: glycosyltransferase [Gammaproteobacteria bacterium]|nr:glycosyltransferase [Gammaproteobacteria bacterium]
MRTHVCHVIESLQPGGLENGVVNVVNGLDASRFISSICCLRETGVFAARIRRPEVGIHTMGWQPGNDPALPIRLARLFRRTRADIVHTRNAEAFFYGFLGAKLAGTPAIIHSEHGRTLPDKPHRMALQRRFLRHVSAAFAVSGQLKRELDIYLKLPPQCIEVIYNGVDVRAVSNAGRQSARDLFRAAASDIVIGSVGRLVPVKNYKLLLHAVCGMVARRNVLLVLIGGGSERAALEAEAVQLGIAHRIRWLGHREDAARLYAGMDVFVLPSHSEGMSNTLLEAMSASLAVVASDVGGNREIVRDGRDGLLFKSNDEFGLRGLLDGLANNPEVRRGFGRNGSERVRRDFSVTAMINRYEGIYERVLSRDRAAKVRVA